LEVRIVPKCRWFLVPLVCCWLAQPAAAASIVAEGTLQFLAGEATVSSTAYVQPAIGDDPFGADAILAAPEPVAITSDDLGGNFLSLTPADLPFDAVVDALTNGENDIVWLIISLQSEAQHGAVGDFESLIFFDDPDGTAQVDLQGYEIHQVDFGLDRFVLSSPGEDPNGDGIWTDYDVSMSLAVWGLAIPEPGPHLLCLQELVLFAVARRPMSRRS